MRVIVRIFAVIGLLAVLLVGGAVALFMSFSGEPALPDAVVLEFDFQQPLPQARPADPLASLLGDSGPTVMDVVGALNAAAKDPKVKGLVARVGGGAQSFGTTQELRDAIARFRAAGKFALVHAETFGEIGNGMQGYYLATAFEQVWLQPMGDLSITGMQANLPFLRGALDKLDVQPQYLRRHEYKSFSELFTETKPTEANLEATEALVGDWFEQWVAGVAAARSLPVDAVRAAVDRAPLLDRDALDAKLVDRLGYYDEVLADARKRAGLPDKAEPGQADGLVALADYRGNVPPPPSDAPTVALIVGSGGITRGEPQTDPLSGETSFGAEAVAEAFQDAIDNPQVKAILFRVDSPGGSAVASEVVRRKVQQARAAGKPVIVSMGDVAASGGYWVSMGADKIVAQPATVTGSIGVLTGKLVTRGLADKLGVSFATVQRGQNAGIWSNSEPFSPSQLARVNAQLDNIYASFTRGVAEGRNMPLEKAEAAAKGRVFTGRQAKELGLVDALGGYDVALQLAREAIGVAPDATVALLPFPRPKSQFELALSLFNDDAKVRVGQMLAADALAEYRPLLAPLSPYLRAQGFDDIALMMPPLGLAGM